MILKKNQQTTEKCEKYHRGKELIVRLNKMFSQDQEHLVKFSYSTLNNWEADILSAKLIILSWKMFYMFVFYSQRNIQEVLFKD